LNNNNSIISGTYAIDALHQFNRNSKDLDIIRNDPKLAIPFFLTEEGSAEKYIVNAPFHNELQDHITANQHSLAVVPRDHGKSHQIVIGKTCYEIGRNPNIRIIVACEKAEHAEKRLEPIKNIIVNSERYHLLFPHVKPSQHDWKSSSFTVEREGLSSTLSTVTAIGAYSAITGMHGDLVICDDISGETAARKQSDRESIKEIFRKTIMLFPGPEGRVIYIATPYHFDDLTMELMRESKKEGGFALFYRAIPDDLTPLWAAKWSTDAMKKRRAIIGQRSFDTAFHLKPQSEKDALFNKATIRSSIKVKCSPYDYEGDEKDWMIVMGVDPAISESVRADYTVLFVAAYNPKTKHKFNLEIIRERMPSTDTAYKIIDLQRKYKCKEIEVEKVGYQKSLAQWTRVTADFPLPIREIESRDPKLARGDTLKVEIDNGTWVFYNHQDPYSEDADPCECSGCMFIREMVEAPNARHDDTWDACSMASMGLNRFIYQTSGGFEVVSYRKE